MAESCAASASCVKLHYLRCGAGNRGPPAHWRKPLFRRKSHHNLDVVPHNAWKYRELSISSPRVNVNIRHQATSFTCTRLGSLASFDCTEASEWVPVIDQVLLISSMLLTYLAGVAPVQKPYSSAKIITGDHLVSESSTLSGRAAKINEDSRCAWDVIKKKLLDSLEATGLATSMGDIAGLEQDSLKRPLSLNAVAEGPKLRLLLAVVMHLEKEVSNIQGNSGSSEDWPKVLSGIVQKSLQLVCIDWLGKELFKDNDDRDVALPSSVIKKFKGDNTILLNIRKSGKEDLYADLLSFLRFGSVRDSSYYDNCLFVAEGISILEDLVVLLADGIASIYLELISVDGNLSNEMNNLSFGLCSLSTRSLQKLRNEVALNQWLHQNLEAVASMYEDRFDLSILQTHSIPESSSYSADNVGWWKELFVKRPATSTYQLQYVAVSNFSMPVKRTRELRALTGWRYYFSLFLELSDITMPLIRTIVDKVSNAISFFLVCLIGRSLGLIYTGIRQSLRWKRNVSVTIICNIFLVSCLQLSQGQERGDIQLCFFCLFSDSTII